MREAFTLGLMVFLVVFSASAVAQSCSSSADCPDLHYCDGLTRAVHVSMRCEAGACVDPTPPIPVPEYPTPHIPVFATLLIASAIAFTIRNR